MASRPAKRRRTEPGPSSAGQGDSQQSSEPLLAQTMTTPQPSSAESHVTSTRPSQSLAVPENMTMPVHEALEYIDPDYKTPHDLYLVLIYAAAAHSDVAEMMDRFACVHRDRIVLQREMRELPATMGSVAQFVPTIPKGPPTRPGRPHGPARPKEIIEAEKAEKAAMKAARKEAQAARHKVNMTRKDKSFAYLVRQTEEELGRTGKYDKSGPKQNWSHKKKRQHWHEIAVEVKENLTWLQEQILQNMIDRERRLRQGVVVDVATFGTKKNGLVAMKEIICTILVDDGELGIHLRENWFSTFLDKFKKAVDLLSPGELAMLRRDREWNKELTSLVSALREKGLTEEWLEDILAEFTPGATIEVDSSSDEDEGSNALVSSDGSEEFSAEETDGALVGAQFLEQVQFEQCNDSEADSSEEEDSEIG